MVSSHTHRVLLIGSGLMTPPLVDYLCKFGDTHITVASNIVEDARKVASRHPSHMDAIYLDVFDVSLLLHLLALPSLTHSTDSSILCACFSINLYLPLSLGYCCGSCRQQSHPCDLIHPTMDAHESATDLRKGWRERDHLQLHLASDA